MINTLNIIEIIIVFILQLSFQLSRTISNRFIAKDKILGVVISTGIIQSLWLISTAIGIKAVYDYDYLTIASYMIGGILGAYLAMKTKIYK